ncbi:uncharacterized protein LOC119068558 [Bradysia coprophila]|uniref:uncharacterized protein LOC119068558 n=1 Tax=Bradysia coprophila TaxID=38358 RepID=UPI00187DA135|nr:uncharacterized protein LOC119068558 [Bradysia coprophila]
MNFLSVCVALCMCIVLASGQFFGNGFGRDFGYSGYNALSGDFGGPSAFSGGLGVGSTNVRDPRQNRGPVVFPDPPQDGPMESSGVIVGASGFGFVPPSGQPDHSATARYLSNRFNSRYFNQFRYF